MGRRPGSLGTPSKLPCQPQCNRNSYVSYTSPGSPVPLVPAGFLCGRREVSGLSDPAAYRNSLAGEPPRFDRRLEPGAVRTIGSRDDRSARAVRTGAFSRRTNTRVYRLTPL